MKKNLLLSLFMAMTMMTLCPQSMMADWIYDADAKTLTHVPDEQDPGESTFNWVECNGDTLTLDRLTLGTIAACYRLDLTGSITDAEGKSYFIGKIGDRALYGNKTQEVILPNTIKYIGEDAFNSNQFICCLELGDDVTIAENAFNGAQVEYIILGKNANIADNAFTDCSWTDSISIGENSTIGEHAFQNLSNQLVVSVPAGELANYTDNDYNFPYICTHITIDEASTEVPYWENGSHAAVLKRTMVKGKWNTFNVPFDINADEVEKYFGEGTKIKRLFNITSEGVVTFKDTTAIAAGYMYLVKNTADLPSPYTFSERAVYAENEIDTDEGDYTISVYDENGESAAMAGFVCSINSNMYAVMAPYNDMNVNIMNMLLTPYILSGDKFYRVDSDVDLKGTRWFIGVMAGASAKKTLSVDFGDSDESVVTGISAVNASRQADGNCYNVLGQKVNANSTGLVIKNGRKLLRK